MPGKLMMILVRVPESTSQTTLARETEKMLDGLGSETQLVEVSEADEACMM